MSNIDKVFFDINSELNQTISSENLNLNKTLNKILENEKNDLKSEKSDVSYEYNKSSLILQESTRNELIEKIKKDQTHYNQNRIHDFKQKRLTKFPQIFNLKHFVIFDPNRKIVENKSHIISKYTFNPLEIFEFDIGAYLNMRDNLAISGYFSNLRFYFFQKRIFQNLFYSFGERRKIFYEANYLIDKNYLIDYMYKYKHLTNESSHELGIYNLNDFGAKLNAGLKIFISSENLYKGASLNLFYKNYFGGVDNEAKEKLKNTGYNVTDQLHKSKSFEAKLKISVNDLKLSGKIKENFLKNFYSITEHKVNLGTIFNYSTNNKMIYKHNSHFYKFGYFQNFDGIGIELGYSRCGFEFSVPIIIFAGDVNFEEISNESLFRNFCSFLKQSFSFLILHYSTVFILKKIKQFMKNRKRAKGKDSYSTEKISPPKEVLDNRSYHEKIVCQIKPQAEKIQKSELEKGQFGLIINFSIYGSKSTIKKILNEMQFISKDKFEEYLIHITSDAENEIVNVSTPVRYLIKSGDKNCFSSILFHQVPKTKIIGFVNPIYKSEKEPFLMINFKIGNGVYTILKKDHEIFQIPEILNIGTNN